jgi:predicted MFS family arabinose efflux permease
MHDLREGASFILRHDLLRPILATAIFFNTGWFVLQSVYVAYAVQNLGMSAFEVGVTLGIYGGGMIIGAVIAPALSRRVSFGTMIVLGPIGGFSAAVIMLMTLWLPSVWVVSLSFLLFGAGPTLWTISTITLRQAVTPNAMLGRVSAFIMTATFGARPFGAAIGAVVAAHSGVPACLTAATGCFLIQLLSGVRLLVSHSPAREQPGVAGLAIKSSGQTGYRRRTFRRVDAARLVSALVTQDLEGV